MDVDVVIIVGFLLLNLGVGLYFGRGVRTIDDYALGAKGFSTATLTATIVATWMSGSFFVIAITETYKGALGFLLGVAYVGNLLIMSYIFVPKVRRFIGQLSAPEILGNIYGQSIRVIAAVASIGSAVSIVALQVKVFSKIFMSFTELDAVSSSCYCTMIIVIYSALGGIRSVVITDVIQLITFGVLIPILAIVFWKSFGGIEAMYHVFETNKNFDYGHIFDYHSYSFWSTLVLFIYYLIPSLNPAFFQRMLITSSNEQGKKAFMYAAIICFIIFCLSCSIGLMTLAHSPDLTEDSVLFFAIDKFSYPLMKGFILVGVISMVMSTADSWLNSSSVIFAQDLCKPLGVRASSLTLSRVFIVLIGLCSIYLTFYTDNLMEIVLIGANFYMPIVTAPLMLGILGFRTSDKFVIIAFVCSLLVIFLWKYNLQSVTGIDSVIPGFIVSLLMIICAHHLFGEEGGWTNRASGKNFGSTAIKILYKNVAFCFEAICKIETYSGYLPKNKVIYTYFSVAVFLTAVMTLSIDHVMYHTNQILINIMQVFAFLIATFFMCNSFITDYISQKYMGIIWIFSVFLSFGIISNFLVLLDGFSHITLIIFTIHLTMIPLLLGWRMSLVIILLGSIISLLLYITQVGLIDSSTITELRFKLLYILLMVGGFSLTVLKNGEETIEYAETEINNLNNAVVTLKQKEGEYQQQIADLNETVVHYVDRVTDQEREIERLGAAAQKILNNVNHELRIPVGNVMNFSQMLQEGLRSYTPEQLEELSEEVYQNSNRLSSMILNMLDLATLSVKKVDLKKSTENFSELVRDRVKTCCRIYLQDKPIRFKLVIEPEILISIDANYIKQVVDNLTINAIRFSEKGTVEVTVKGYSDRVSLTISDEGIGIPKAELYDIFDPFRMGSNTVTKAEGRGVGLALCKSAVEAHGGVIKAESPEGKGAVFSFVLPLR